jgi:hypothetical protein
MTAQRYLVRLTLQPAPLFQLVRKRYGTKRDPIRFYFRANDFEKYRKPKKKPIAKTRSGKSNQLGAVL